MKRSLTLLLAALTLAFALTACGGRGDTDQGGQSGTQHETAVDGETGKGDSHTDTNGGSLAEDAGNAVNDGLHDVENAVDELTGGAARTHRG